MLVRGILELGAQWSIKCDDNEQDKMASFERYMVQLKPYYFDYKYVLWRCVLCIPA